MTNEDLDLLATIYGTDLYGLIRNNAGGKTCHKKYK